ncbi:TPA: hypothetical protein ACS71B_003732 [Providencia alcalifaciens]
MLSGEICVTQFPDNPQPSRGHGILGQAADSVGCELTLGLANATAARVVLGDHRQSPKLTRRKYEL